MHNIYYLRLSGEHRCPLGYLFFFLLTDLFHIFQANLIKYIFFNDLPMIIFAIVNTIINVFALKKITHKIITKC